MPYTYEVALSEKVPADQLESDLNGVNGPPIDHAHGGTSVAGHVAVVVCKPRIANHKDWEALSYVETVTEHRSIPTRKNSDGTDNPDFSPPYELDSTGRVVLLE